jgi:hypothetical protein
MFIAQTSEWIFSILTRSVIYVSHLPLICTLSHMSAIAAAL